MKSKYNSDILEFGQTTKYYYYNHSHGYYSYKSDKSYFRHIAQNYK